MNIQEQIKKINFKKTIYPAISILFFGIITLIFIYSAQFFIQNVNKAFLIIDNSMVESQIVKVNLTNYYTVAKKLGIAIPTQKKINNLPQATIQQTNQLITGSSTQQIQGTSTPGIIASSTNVVPPILMQDKKSIKIEILNSTKTSGLATILKTLLENAGFVVSKTGNQTTIEETTLLKVKQSKQNSPLIRQIRGIILTKYSLGENQILDETNEFDVIIVIGKK